MFENGEKYQMPMGSVVCTCRCNQRGPSLLAEASKIILTRLVFLSLKMAWWSK